MHRATPSERHAMPQPAPGFDYAFTPRILPDDLVDREVTALARLWNRCEPDSRLEFLEFASEAAGGLVEQC